MTLLIQVVKTTSLIIKHFMEEKITDIKLNRKGENNCEYVKELTLQFFSNSKNFLDIPCHYLLDFVQFIIQFSDVPLTVDV